MIKRIIKLTLGLGLLASTSILSSCKDQESYIDLLNAEDKACNWYLSQHRVENAVPADGNFETGENAPYYRLTEDGFVYMQVIDKGDPDLKPEADDVVYFRFMRRNIKDMYNNQDALDKVQWVGNAVNLDSESQTTFFNYKDDILTSASVFGYGIQDPLEYVNYNSEVNLVLKSYRGFQSDQTYCNPYIINIKYFKAIY